VTSASWSAGGAVRAFLDVAGEAVCVHQARLDQRSPVIEQALQQLGKEPAEERMAGVV